MKKVGFVVLAALIAVSVMAGQYQDRAIGAMTYITDPVNGLFNPAEGLPWVVGDPTAPTPPALDNRAPSYLGSYFFSTAALIAGMHATGVNTDYADNAIERVFLENFNSNGHPAAGVEPWWNESTVMLGFVPDSMLMCDALIPWRLSSTMAFPTTASTIYLERVLWSTYFLTLTGEIEYTPYIAKIIRGIRQNPTFFNNTNGAIRYNGVDNLYLTSLWGLVLKSYWRSWELTPVRLRPGLTVPPIDRAEVMSLSNDAWNYVNSNLTTYMSTTLPAWWAAYSATPLPRGLQRWEYMAVIMFAAIQGETVFARNLWDAHVDDVTPPNWAISVRTYFRTGAIWNGGLVRGYYEPMHRYPGIYPFFEMVNLEMYRATLDQIFMERFKSLEAVYWDPRWGRLGRDMWHSELPPTTTQDNPTVVYNALHAMTTAYYPSVEISGIWSNLPSIGTAPYDYNANTAQDHVVTVRVTNTGLVPVDHLVLRFNETYTSGSRVDMVAVPLIPVGGYVDVTYDVGGPGMAGNHTIVCNFTGASSNHVEFTTVDNNLLINVQNRAQIDIIYSGGSPATAPRSPEITRGQAFDFEVRIRNNGGAAIRSVELNLTQSSPFGLALTFPGGMSFSGDVNIAGGSTGSVFFSAIAPMGTGSTLGNDLRVDVTLVRATDENTRANIPVGPLTDLTENFNIQNPPQLSVTNVNVAPFWLNAVNNVNIWVTIANAVGDNAAADSFNVYEQMVEFVASIVGGLGGVATPVASPVFLAAGASAAAQFVITNEGATENAIVDIHYTGHYHDGNDGLNAEPAASPLTAVAPGGMGIDILAPTVNPIAPVAGATWPGDDIVRINAMDNLSGVAAVDIYLRRQVGGDYWNFDTGVWQAGFTARSLAYNPVTGYWERHLPTHPAGDYIMYIDCDDIAGNAMPTDYVPLGNVAYIHLVDISTNLWRGSLAAPVPAGSPWEYECDWNWAYRCSVLVYNPNAFQVNNVVLNLYSTSPQTMAGIVNLTGPVNIPALSSVWYKFTVTAPAFDFIDSLYAHAVAGTHTGGLPIAEQITDSDLLIKVEKPVDFSIVNVWVEGADINNWLGDPTDAIEDTALVTKGQTLRYYVTIRNNGVDKIDSIWVFPMQAPNLGSALSWAGTATPWIYNMMPGEERTLSFRATASTVNSGTFCPAQWDQDLMLGFDLPTFTANNHQPGYTTGLWSVVDDRAPIGIQEHPELITNNWALNGALGSLDVVWINMTNTVNFDLWLQNQISTCGVWPFDDRAAADRLLSSPDYTAQLELWDFSDPDPWDHYRTDANILGLGALSAVPSLVPAGQTSQLGWGLSWNGTFAGTHEGIWWVVDRVRYGDNNDQLNLFAANSPHQDQFDRFIGIDVSRPIVDIIWPIDSTYADFPETMLVLANDAISGLLDKSIKVQFEDPTGAIYNGTNWGAGSWWFTAHEDITFGADTFWYDTPTPTVEGCWTYRAFGHDIAGNQSLIDEVDFIWDVTRPDCEIIYPAASYYSYTASNIWDKRIEVWALDDTTVGSACVAHVKNVYVAIFDIIDSVWWNGTGWLASGTAYWLPCTPTADPEVWAYNGYTDNSSVALEIYSYARDKAGNFGPPCDTLRYVFVDEEKPNSVITDRFATELPNMWFVVPADWNTNMQNQLWGQATDYFTRVDSIRYSVWDSLNNRWWNGAGWDPSGEIWNRPNQYNFNGGGWFTPDAPAHAPGTTWGVGSILQWRSPFPMPGFGYYRIRTKSIDDMGHVEPGFDAQNEKVLVFDNCAPVVHPRYPAAGAVYFIWDWVDSFVVFAWDSCGFNGTGGMGRPVNEVRFWIINPDGKYWGYVPVLGYRWCDFDISVPGVQVNDSHWVPINIPEISQEGTYTMFVRARDGNGNQVLNAWSWTITVSGRFLTIQALPNDPGRDWFFVDEEFTLRVIAWSHPGVTDISFAHQFIFGDNMPLPDNFELLVPGPYYAFRGTLDVAATCHVPVLGLEAFVDAPTSGLPRASTAPIDIIQLIDADLGGFVMDNSAANGYWDDQGNWMWLHHNRTAQDPAYTGGDPIDTMSVKIQGYHYFRDMNTSPAPGDTNWQPIVITGNASDGDSVRLMFGNNNTFIPYDYSMIVEVLVKGVGTVVFTERIPLGNARPFDNIAPQVVGNVAISRVPGGIRLDWPEAVLGSDLGATPEINPAANIVYDIYRFTDPLIDLDARAAVPAWAGVTDLFFVDPSGAGDVTTPYYYTVKARDYDGNVSPDYPHYVGEVDYLIGAGWNPIAYPLPVAGLVDPNDYVARLGVPLTDIYAYLNPPGVWEELMVGPITFRNLDNDGSEDMLAFSGWSGIATWTGDVPGDLYIAYNLAAGFNGIMIPLIRSDLGTAGDLYYELQGLGLSPVTVARMVPGVGWDDIVVTGGTVYFDFPIYPGQSYLVWVDAPGVWPEYARTRPTIKGRLPISTSDRIPTPKACAIPVYAEDKAQIERISAKAIWGETVQNCSVDGNLVRVEMSRFEGIKVGEEIRVEIVGNDGVYVGETSISVGDEPVFVASAVTLAKVGMALPENYALHANVPNPFNPATSISFDLPEDVEVNLSIYNINGKLVRKVVGNKLEAGYHTVVWDGRDDSGRDASAGVYFYSLRAGDFTAQRRMMLVK